MSDAERTSIRRRSFLACCSRLGVGATLFPGALWAQSDEGRSAITAGMIDQAARLAGLEFSEPDRQRMIEGIRANLASFEELRSLTSSTSKPTASALEVSSWANCAKLQA